jgi:hypothetical protein
MIKKNTQRLHASIFIILLLATPAAARAELASPNQPDASTEQRQTRSLRMLRINVTADQSVTITTEATIIDAVSYISGERYVVVIPQAVVAGINSDVASRHFTNFQIDQRGEDVSISFLMKPGSVARLEPKSNGVSVMFVASDRLTSNNSNGIRHEPASFSTTPAVVTRPEPAPPGTAAVPVVNTVLPNPAAASPNVPQPGGLSALLNNLFPGASQNVTADTTNVDLAVPESPAFTVLGVTPNTVVRPGSPKAFTTALLNGLDQNGNFQTGLAFDFTPFMMFNGENITIKDYNEQYMTRLLSRAQFSFATTNGASADDNATRLAVGLSLTIWDKGDPRVYHPNRGDDDVLQCFANSLQLPPIIAPNTPPEQINQINEANKAVNDNLADACRDRARKANWNRSSWVIAYAPSWIRKTGDTTAYKWNGGAAWTSIAYGFEGISSLQRIAQVIFHARYRSRERAPDPDNPARFLTQNSTFFGARFRAGSPKFGLNIEDTYIRTRVLGGGTDNLHRFSIGAEARITDNLYFVITSGGHVGADNDQKRGFVISSFKYGFNRKSQFNPQPQ